MRKILLFTSGGVLLIGALFTGFGLKTQVPANSLPPSLSPEEPLQERRALVPDLAFETYEGRLVRLRSLVGKPLIINVWASWCPFCFKELPDLAFLQAEFANQAVVVAVNRMEEAAAAKRFTDALGITKNLIFLLDRQDMFYNAIGGFSMPETIIIDREGFIREHRRGPVGVPEMRKEIQKLINIKNAE